MIDFVNVPCSGQHVWDCAIVWGVSPCLVVISDALQPYTFNQLNFAEVRNFVSFGEVKFCPHVAGMASLFGSLHTVALLVSRCVYIYSQSAIALPVLGLLAASCDKSG